MKSEYVLCYIHQPPKQKANFIENRVLHNQKIDNLSTDTEETFWQSYTKQQNWYSKLMSRKKFKNNQSIKWVLVNLKLIKNLNIWTTF